MAVVDQEAERLVSSLEKRASGVVWRTVLHRRIDRRHIA